MPFWAAWKRCKYQGEHIRLILTAQNKTHTPNWKELTRTLWLDYLPSGVIWNQWANQYCYSAISIIYAILCGLTVITLLCTSVLSIRIFKKHSEMAKQIDQGLLRDQTNGTEHISICASVRSNLLVSFHCEYNGTIQRVDSIQACDLNSIGYPNATISPSHLHIVITHTGMMSSLYLNETKYICYLDQLYGPTFSVKVACSIITPKRRLKNQPVVYSVRCVQCANGIVFFKGQPML